MLFERSNCAASPLGCGTQQTIPRRKLHGVLTYKRLLARQLNFYCKANAWVHDQCNTENIWNPKRNPCIGWVVWDDWDIRLFICDDSLHTNMHASSEKQTGFVISDVTAGVILTKQGVYYVCFSLAEPLNVLVDKRRMLQDAPEVWGDNNVLILLKHHVLLLLWNGLYNAMQWSHRIQTQPSLLDGMSYLTHADTTKTITNNDRRDWHEELRMHVLIVLTYSTFPGTVEMLHRNSTNLEVTRMFIV